MVRIYGQSLSAIGKFYAPIILQPPPGPRFPAESGSLFLYRSQYQVNAPVFLATEGYRTSTGESHG